MFLHILLTNRDLATHGAQMILEANGPDAEEALTALAMVIETDKLPGDLD